MTKPLKVPLIIVSAPSGAGKSTLVEKALQDFDFLVDSVSYTTRAIRAGESEGHPYHFVTKEKFVELKDKGFFVETAEVHGHYYGTPRHQIDDAHKVGKTMIMDVDVQGAESLKRLYPDALTVFILPPSIDELRRRLEKRDKGKTNNLEVRIQNAAHEMSKANQFQHQIVNDNIDRSYAQLKKIIEEI
jgi:guanylate kinase